ncbi:MAG: hypothetical protein AAFV88_06150 [Planctomycetota bacterium]
MDDSQLRLSRSFRRALLVIAFGVVAPGGLFIGSQAAAQGYTPDHPEVMLMVDQGLEYLEGAQFRSPGEQLVCAYAHFKVHHDENAAIVVDGIQNARAFAAKAQQSYSTMPTGGNNKFIYEAAVAVLFLCDLSPKKYRNELMTLKRFFDEAQMGIGSYTYPGVDEGDVSQTQYAILAIWTLDRYGFKLDYNRVGKVASWLLRVQDRDGPWPYHGFLPPGNTLITQNKEVSLSMALAGAGSLLIGGDAMGAWGATRGGEAASALGLPKAVKLYLPDENAERRTRAKFPKEKVFQAIERMERWRDGRRESLEGGLEWYFYMMYTMERYESFLEIAQGDTVSPSPDWYNEGVRELKRMQDPDGGWKRRASTEPAVSTAFAILFLIRSTQRTLGTSVGAATRGGQGFKGDVGKAKLVNGMAVVQRPAQSVAGMLDLLEEDGADKLDGKALANNTKLSADPVERAAQLDRLERLVRGSQSWQARRVAAKVLGTSDELRVVPSLIYALTDPDTSVRRYARDGLRFISRKFEGFGMPDQPTNQQLRDARRKWRAWYLTMRPGHVFLDDI